MSHIWLGFDQGAITVGDPPPNLERAIMCGTNLKLIRKERAGQLGFESAPHCLSVDHPDK